MKTCVIVFFAALLSDSPILAGPFGQIYGPQSPELMDSGLTIETSRWKGRTFFEVRLVPKKKLENVSWESEFVLWADREGSRVEVSCTSNQSSENGIYTRFSIDDQRIEDADFQFQSFRDGNPGLYFELDLKAFRDATTRKSTFPNKGRQAKASPSPAP